MWKVTLAPLWPPRCHPPDQLLLYNHFSKSQPAWSTFYKASGFRPTSPPWSPAPWSPPSLHLSSLQFRWYISIIPQKYQKITPLWILSFLLFPLQLTEPLMSLFGPDGIFLYFAVVSALNTLFVLAMVPETHGETFSHFHTRESSQKLLTVNRIWKPQKMYFITRENLGCATSVKNCSPCISIFIVEW